MNCLKNKRTIPFTVASKLIKYLEINLTKELKDLYTKSYETLMKEIEEDSNTWKDTLCSWIGIINIIKMSILPKRSRVQSNLYQNSNGIFHR